MLGYGDQDQMTEVNRLEKEGRGWRVDYSSQQQLHSTAFVMSLNGIFTKTKCMMRMLVGIVLLHRRQNCLPASVA